MILFRSRLLLAVLGSLLLAARAALAAPQASDSASNRDDPPDASSPAAPAVEGPGSETESGAPAEPSDPKGEARAGGGGPIIAEPGAGYGTGINVSALFGVGGYGNVFGIGFGALGGYPIVRDGFIPSLNESFHIEAGVLTNIGFYSSGQDGIYVSPVGGVRWDFHFFENLTAYAALRTGVGIGSGRFGTIFYFDGALGGFWRFSQLLAVRFELGGGIAGAGVSGGMAFFF